ncbi:hypothetical protein HYW84_00245 [Candidatus Peregrinibacteria bacterium]|nr:hypothetical protein [Candidatus Peregrinibacteria bacterium]
MKRLPAILLLAALVSGCGGGSTTLDVVCKEQFWNGVVALCLPAKWIVLEREKLEERGVPEQVIVAFQSEQAVSGQAPTLTVTSETLPAALDSAGYSKASIRSVASLPGYKLIDSRETEIEGQKVELHVFTAQPVAGEPERRFFQLSAVAANIGYTFTALTPVSISDQLQKEILLIMNSVRFSEPAAETN